MADGSCCLEGISRLDAQSNVACVKVLLGSLQVVLFILVETWTKGLIVSQDLTRTRGLSRGVSLDGFQ